MAGLPAGADTPETGLDPNVTLTVNPDDGLSDGQTVMVTGTGFAPNAAGLIRECAGSVALPECDTVVSGIFFTDASGVIPPSPMTVNRVITTFTTTYNCGISACALVAAAGGKSSRHHISFAGAGTIPPTSSPTTVPGRDDGPPHHRAAADHRPRGDDDPAADHDPADHDPAAAGEHPVRHHPGPGPGPAQPPRGPGRRPAPAPRLRPPCRRVAAGKVPAPAAVRRA